jgi:hypothetical protein
VTPPSRQRARTAGAHADRRAGRAPRRTLRPGILAIALVASLAVAGTATAAVVPLPRVSAKTKETHYRGHAAIVVRSMLVQHIHGTLTVRCNHCRRLVGRIRVTRPSGTSKRCSGVNWILSTGRAVKVTVVRKSRYGRYLLLIAKRRHGRLTLIYKQSGCLKAHGKQVHCPPGTPPLNTVVVPTAPVVAPAPEPTPVTPPVAPKPKPKPAPPPPPPPATTDTSPCGAQVTVSWSSEHVQHCLLVSALPPNGWIPVFTRPVARASGAANPSATAGWLHGVANQYFVCQRDFSGVEYYYPAGVRNRWWAYTLSDDGKWGWTPEVFFQGGNNDERDKGLVLCGSNHT